MPKNKNTLLLALPRNEKSTAMAAMGVAKLSDKQGDHPPPDSTTNLTKNDHVIEISLARAISHAPFWNAAAM